MKKKQADESMSAKMPAYEGKKPYIFISYRHLDSERVMAVIEELRRRDDPYLLWYDEGIPPGSEWPRNISEHLKHSGAVVYFVSKDFLESVNCDNEVKNGIIKDENNDTKDIYVYALDGSAHKDLRGYPVVHTTEELVSLLPDKYIGTNKDYERSDLRVYNGNIWNAFIPLFVVLAAAFAVAAYGLMTGWFDIYINPQTEPERVVSWRDVEYDEDADMGETVEVPITYYEEDPQTAKILKLQGITVPWEEISFEDSASKTMLYKALGLDEKEKLTYGDIEYNTDIQELRFDEINDEVIGLISKYQYLRRLYIGGGSFTSLEPLTKAQNLRRVYISSEAWNANTIVIPDLRTSEKNSDNARVFRVYISNG